MYPLIEGTNLISLPTDEYIHVTIFESMFGTKEEHGFNFDYLYNHERTTKRWKMIFEKWNELGILT